MVFAGLVVIMAGFAVSVASLGLAASTSGRLGLVLVGIVISLIGIMGILNPAYMKNAIWKKK